MDGWMDGWMDGYDLPSFTLCVCACARMCLHVLACADIFFVKMLVANLIICIAL